MEREPGGFRRIERREFLKFSGAVYLVAATGCTPERPRKPPAPPTEAIDPSKLPFPPSAAYVLVDTRKCQGCLSCMLACSLAHEGRENLSLARLERWLEAVVGMRSLLELSAMWAGPKEARRRRPGGYGNSWP